MILEGDLNHIVFIREIWGETTSQDPLRDDFGQLLVSNRLIDMQPHKLVPTWRAAR